MATITETGGDGKLQKMDVDYSTTTDEKIPLAETLAKQGKLTEAIDMLMSLEKQARTASDTHSTSRILVAMVKICFDTKNWDALNENIVLLTKKRGQIKQSVTKMIQEACTYVEKMPNKETRLKLIDTLRTVTAGKIYVEIERARLTRTLAKIREDEGDIATAANVLQELQVETFGSMDRKEKVEFILEQMRLCLAKKDYIRTNIISKKVSKKFFEDKDTVELKLKFYQLMIELDQHEGSYLAICKHYLAIYNSESIQADKEKMKEALCCVVLYLTLGAYDNEQSDLLHRVFKDKNMDEVTFHQKFLKNFITNEIINWSGLCKEFEKGLRSGDTATFVFGKGEGGDKRWAELKNRVVEHNIRVMAKYYTRVKMTRMAELLDLSESDTEEFLSKLVVDKTIVAKIDRLEGVVSFSRTKDPNTVLNTWATRVADLMTLVHRTNHLINKEQMVHQITPEVKAA